jgi:hypothetical protein
LKQNYRGFQQSLSKGVLSVVGPAAATYALLVLETSIALGRSPRPETAMRRCIFDETLVQVNAKSICYSASKADQNTPFQNIISHFREAKEDGWDEYFCLWEDTPHCNHLGKHEEEYTKAIADMWIGGAATEQRVRSKL